MLTTQEAQDLLRHCLEDGKVIPGKHFREELAQEGLTFEDVLFVLRRGHIYDPPEQDIKTREWKYRSEGTEPDGKRIKIVFCFKAVDTMFLITVFSMGAKRR